jgi:hypothetical protein
MMLVFAAHYWAVSSSGTLMLLRVQTRMSGYDGCLCDDCQKQYFGRTVFGGGQVYFPHLGYGDPGDIAIRLCVFGAALFSFGACGRRPITWLSERPKPGLCKRCGYSLQGLPVETACPECGAPQLATPTPSDSAGH